MSDREPEDELLQIRLPSTSVSRRGFLQLIGAGAALAGLDGCARQVPEKILPYSVAPPEVTPGQALAYATSMLLDGFAAGLVVESHEGRPTKIEGNPAHPASLGASSVWQQAWVLQLYDPDRGRGVLEHGLPSSWARIERLLQQPRADRGAGLRILVEPTSSPALLRQLERIRARHPLVRVSSFAPEPVLDGTVAGARLAFGQPLQPVYDLSRADVVLALDADFLDTMPFALRYARDWSSRRRPADHDAHMSRLYVVEPALTPTGMAADHRLRRRGSEVGRALAAIAARVPQLAGELRALAAGPGGKDDARFADAVARDLTARAPGATAIVVGARQPAAVHALAFALNAALGNVGRTLRLIAPQLYTGDQDLPALTDELRAGRVDTLLVFGGNPVYAAPADLQFDRALTHVRDSVYCGLYADETAQACRFYAPLAHGLEAWGDGRAYDGTLSLAQPLVRPLWDARSAVEILALAAGDRAPDGLALLRDTHATLDWEATLQRGFVPQSAAPPVAVTLAAAAPIAQAMQALADPGPNELELALALSPTVHDGRFTNNPWLLELPEPATKLTWDNAALMSPATAARLQLNDQDVVELRAAGKSVRAPVLTARGHADDAVTLHLGWGRRGAESLARGRGANGYALRTRRAPSFMRVELRKTGAARVLATTQRHFELEGRPIALSTTLDEWRRHPDFTEEHKKPEPSIFPAVEYKGLQWAMSIDLTLCTGCSACMVACEAENNILVVGKNEVVRRREMHWLRIDSYYSGDESDPGVVNQPMMCQHCETAPCEYVCPVNATVHSDEGLNEMVYNRCVGTRFCSNNCPYKVRRFNFFSWISHNPANRGTVELQRNPDVTVRERGVMEKCTYCVQRIRRVEIRAELEKREVAPGEVVTACQQACPTRAIEFGSLSHPDTEMVRRRAEERSYEVLHDQGTRPRTMYLARVDNPNPALSIGAGHTLDRKGPR